jgi:hypothetical protein
LSAALSARSTAVLYSFLNLFAIVLVMKISDVAKRDMLGSVIGTS